MPRGTSALATPVEPARQPRPRVEGDREREILAATVAILGEVGYDRLTLDAVAVRAHASKATLYRRWHGKVSLVIDAIASVKAAPSTPDTGTLRGDLLAAFCSPGGLSERSAQATFASVVTAMSRDRAFAHAFRRQVLAPRTAATRAIFERARERGEIAPDVDLDLLAPALAGIVLHRTFVLGHAPDRALVTRVIDQIILPAATWRGSVTTKEKEPS